jgi:hypothetical protein
LEVQVGKSYYLRQKPELVFTITEIEHWRYWGKWNDRPATPVNLSTSTLRADKMGEDWMFSHSFRLAFGPCSKLHRYLYCTNIGQE